MAAPTRILALELGTQTVTLAELKAAQDGGLTLVNVASRELLADPAADSTRQAQARMAITEMVTAMGYKGQVVNYAIASQSVFTRFVKLPSVGEEQVDQIVTFEAQQNVPYPINEVVWDYQLVETGDSSQVEVVIVAIKSDLLDEINEAVEGSSLRASTIDVSPMALYNAYRYNYSDLAGCSLVVDIGARTTNLIFVEPKKVFSRSIPTGGNTITGAIAKDFNEPFQGAEERKKRDGFVSLGGAYADPDDPDAARISKITRNTMTRLHAEITRSISFYRSQQGGAQPVRVFLAGGAASMPYMREFFQEKFSMPVEFFNPLRNVKVGPTLNVEDIGHRAHTFGGIIGLALRRAASCPMELNLRPASVIRRETQARQKPALIVAALCLLAGLAVAWLYFDHAAKTTAAVVKGIHPTAQLPEKLAEVDPAPNSQPTVEELKSYEDKMAAVRGQVKAQEETASPLLEAIRERDYWTQVLNDVNSRLPNKQIWITSFEPGVRKEPAATAAAGAPKAPVKKTDAPKDQTVVEVQGLYILNADGTRVVDDFIAKLGESELYTVDAAPPHIREVPNETDLAFRYSFALVLKNPVAFAPITRVNAQ